MRKGVRVHPFVGLLVRQGSIEQRNQAETEDL